MNKDGSCHTKIVEKVVENLKSVGCGENNYIVIRSTVPPGTADNLGCYFMPEFLTEKNFKPIVKNTPTPRRSTSVNGPHTMLLISPKITFIIIYKEYRIHYFDFHSRFLIH